MLEDDLRTRKQEFEEQRKNLHEQLSQALLEQSKTQYTL